MIIGIKFALCQNLGKIHSDGKGSVRGLGKNADHSIIIFEFVLHYVVTKTQAGSIYNVLSIHLYICQSSYLYPSNSPTHLFIQPSFYPSVHSFICPFIHQLYPYIYQLINLSIALSTNPPIHLSILLSICPFIHPFVHPSVD